VDSKVSDKHFAFTFRPNVKIETACSSSSTRLQDVISQTTIFCRATYPNDSKLGVGEVLNNCVNLYEVFYIPWPTLDDGHSQLALILLLSIKF
jgi:hypothetical protein